MLPVTLYQTDKRMPRNVQLSGAACLCSPLHRKDNLLISFSCEEHQRAPPMKEIKKRQMWPLQLAYHETLTGASVLHRATEAAISAGRENTLILIRIYTFKWNLQRLTGRVLSVHNTLRERQRGGGEGVLQTGRWIKNGFCDNSWNKRAVGCLLWQGELGSVTEMLLEPILELTNHSFCFPI